MAVDPQAKIKKEMTYPLFSVGAGQDRLESPNLLDGLFTDFDF